MRVIIAQLQTEVTYLDHGGTTLYAKSLITQFANDLTANIFGNPHSASPSSKLSTERVEEVRTRVLRFFNADPDHFDVVFVANATAAIKLVAEAFHGYGTAEGRSGFRYGYHKDAHTSLVGIRELATGGSKCFESDRAVENWIDGLEVSESHHGRGRDLFAYPAQSNLNGHRLPLDWAGRLRKLRNSRHCDIYTLLDAAAYVSTAQLDLSDVNSAPDFVALSFYKIFGFPDLGALIVQHRASHMLRCRPYFGGGTVDMVISVGESWHVKKDGSLHEQLEDGTLPFHNIIALGWAMDIHQRLYGSMASISAHTCQLVKLVYDKLSSLRHANGRAVCEIYKDPGATYGDSKTQGATIAFNVRNSQGGWIGKSEIEQLANKRGIHLRTGGVCNPGGIATVLKLAPWEMRRNYSEGMRCGDEFDIIRGKPTGVVRVSLGAMTSLADVETFINFMEQNWVEKAQPLSIQPPLNWPQSVSPENSYVKGLKVFPIEGCSGWDVPTNTAWELSPHGLAWNHEWCLVRPRARCAMDPKIHPRMAFLQPSLNLQAGILKIRVESLCLDDTALPRELTVSLWDSPLPATTTTTEDLTRRPQIPHRQADAFLDPEIESFFTAAVGTPCTLARFPDLRRKDSPQACPNPSLPPSTHSWRPRRDLHLLNSLSVAPAPIGLGDTEVSINLSSTLQPLSSPLGWQFLKIGTQHFSVMEAGPTSLKKPAPNAGVIGRKLRLLTCPGDESLTAQFPTLSVGDGVQVFVDPEWEDEGDAAMVEGGKGGVGVVVGVDTPPQTPGEEVLRGLGGGEPETDGAAGSVRTEPGAGVT